jgi:thioredoxin 1
MTHTGEAVPTEPIALEDAAAFDDRVAGHDVVLVDFYADWCGPCRMMEPAVEAVAADTDAAVLKVDVDRFQALASEYGVQGIPTLLVFADGEPADRMVGAQTEDALREAVEGHLD